jgi:hypothetical protein
MQPDYDSKIIGAIMSSYFGGRAEVHRRREIVQALYCDFASMYPTVCTLMGLWKFVLSCVGRPDYPCLRDRRKQRCATPQRPDCRKVLAAPTPRALQIRMISRAAQLADFERREAVPA